jgi:hypothetical protein
MDGDDIGTVRWFGESWGAPVNDPRARVEAPITFNCMDCSKWIESDDSGFMILDGLVGGYVAFHKDCFFDAIGVPHD